MSDREHWGCIGGRGGIQNARKNTALVSKRVLVALVQLELLDVEGKNIYVKLTGACTGCQMASMTLSGIQQRLIEELGEFVKVVPVSSPAHSAMAEV